MLTLFTIPKAFQGRTAELQRNALASWMRLEPRVEILVFGNDAGVGEAAAAIGARHVPEVAHNEYGTPLVSSLFEQAQRLAVHDVLCYVNADIALLSDFLPAVAQVAGVQRRFLIGGQRWNIDLPDGWRVGAPDWEAALRALVGKSGRSEGPQAIDYFVFPRGLYPRMPPFAIGRTAWDNWLLLEAWRSGAAVVDATAAITAIHFNHDYSHAGGRDRVFNGPEAVRNRELCDSVFCDSIFSLVHASHVLSEGGLKKTQRMMGHRLDLLGFRHPVLAPALRTLREAVRPFRAVRRPDPP
jgi:hypothetical protein